MADATISFAAPLSCFEFYPFCVGRIPTIEREWAYNLSIRLGYGTMLHSLVTNNAELQKQLDGTAIRKFDENISGSQELNDTESQQIGNAWRLFAATLLYMKAFPGLIEKGPPGNALPLERRSIIKAAPRVATISIPPELKNSPSPHIRRFHLRTLRDDRFRRSPDGTARVVAVRQSIIGDISQSRTAREPHGFNVKTLKGGSGK